MSKFLITSLFIATSWHYASAQVVNIPDSLFLKHLIEKGHDRNGDGAIQESEALLVNTIEIKSTPDSIKIKTLEGISHFTNLEELLLRSTQIVHLDLSENKNLENFDVFGGATIETLKLPNSELIRLRLQFMQTLKEVDFRGQSKLEILQIDGVGISELDISDLRNLKELTLRHLEELRSIDVSNQVNLEELRLLTTPIETLDLSSLGLLNTLQIEQTNISQLDLTKQPELQYLDIKNSLIENLNTIDFHPEARLIGFEFGDLDKFDGFDQIDFSQNVFSELAGLVFDDNFNEEYSFSGLTNLNAFHCNSSLVSLDLNHMRNLDELSLQACYQLKYLQINNGSKEQLNFSNVPLLEAICCDYNQANEVSDYLDSEDISCSLNSYCAFTDFENRSTISGTLNIEQNTTNCPYDKILNNRQKLNLRKNNISFLHITGPSGDYKFAVTPGEYDLVPNIESPHYIPSPVSYDFEVLNNNSSLENDFTMIPEEGKRDLEIMILPLGPSRPGFTTEYLVQVENNGTTCITDEVTLRYEVSLTSYLSSDITNVEVDNNRLSWTVSDLGPYEKIYYKISFEHNKPTDPNPLNGGETLSFIAYDEDLDQDLTPIDNLFILKDNIVNSYDPNDIRCLEGTSISEGRVGEYAHYLVRFENTGTANAINVVVQDSIDLEKFEFETLEIVDASHEAIGRLLPEGSAEFIFADINLAFDDENNDGYVLFKIKTKDNLIVGDNISSQANIFFDFNYPIVTNLYATDILANDNDGDGFAEDIDCDDNDAAVNPLAEDIPNNGIDEDCDGKDSILSATYNQEMSDHNIYPNPAVGVAYIESAFENVSIKLYNVSGQLILKKKNADVIDISQYEGGTYLMELIDEQNNNRHFERLVILK